MLVGAGTNAMGSKVTYDCWKPVVHDTSREPSDGMLLKDLLCHPDVTSVTMRPGHSADLPIFTLKNTWNETFEIEYLLLLDPRQLVCHARPIEY